MLVLLSVLLLSPVDDRIWVPVDVEDIKAGRQYTLGAPYLSVGIKESIPIPINDEQMKRVQAAFDAKLPTEKLTNWLVDQMELGRLYPIKPGTRVKVLQVKPKTETVDIVFLDGKYRGRKAVVPFRGLCTRE